MSDIVERLRLWGQHYEVCNEAADEIERLRAQTDTTIKDQIIAGHIDNFMKQEAEIERLWADAKASNAEAYRAWAVVQDKEAEDKFKVRAYVAEIERLRASRQLLSDALDTTKAGHERMQAEIEELYEALQVCKELKDGYRADLLKLRVQSRQSPDDSKPMSSGGPPQQ